MICKLMFYFDLKSILFYFFNKVFNIALSLCSRELDPDVKPVTKILIIIN